jgi:hypothetical protein
MRIKAMPTKAKLRELVSTEFRNLMVGPMDGENEFIAGKRGLTLRYLTGILFPQGFTRTDLAAEGGTFDDDEDKETKNKSEDFGGDVDNPLSMANESLPSSVGISFTLKKEQDFVIECSAARYVPEQVDKELGFRRQPLEKTRVESESIPLHGVPVWGEMAALFVTRRPSRFSKASEVVTVSLVNIKEQDTKKPNAAKNVANRLYQVALCCSTLNNEHIYPYQSDRTEVGDDLEENILSLQYSDKPIYAVGHGASVDWSSSATVQAVSISYVPKSIVERPLFDTLRVAENDEFKQRSIFDISRLAKGQDRGAIVQDFQALNAFYQRWITAQKAQKKGHFKAEEDTLVCAMEACLQRMQNGIAALAENDKFWQAFVWANQAMLFQIEQSGRLKRERSQRTDWPIAYSAEGYATPNLEFPQFSEADKPHWRPFQLAFFLTAFLDLEEEENSQRTLVDLIWFSTGGGKTEAYLFLASYELFRRRCRYQTPQMGYGTGVLTRYTLRFLTTDQFTRTASLVCALEKVRIQNSETLGDEPFSVGLFVGNDKVTHRTISFAQDGLNKLKQSPKASHRFQLSECPNCGTGLIPEDMAKDEYGQIPGLGIDVTATAVEYRCVNKQCVFSQALKIPLRVVDDHIYSHPPSIVLGTVDKLAMVPQKELARSLFGIRPRHQDSVVPPSLIIQDELHLISGPLGTIVAIYEAGFDELIKHQQKALGIKPWGAKYIASSATVRDSNTQIQRLMGRESAIFPPRGLRIHDAFFATTDINPDNGRMYLGVMAQGLRSTSAAHWVSGALLQAVRHVADKVQSKEELDFLWTLLCYCNSKRELGLINAAVNQEIIDRMKVCAGAQNGNPQNIGALRKEEVSADNVSNIGETRDALLTAVKNTDKVAVRDFVPCTNMISVGIDIDRLGCMLVNGQPKTTSEYIQASSRVGRSPIKHGPGLVVTLYSPAKPRDRSHYEHFKAYHQTLYQLVEPTSVTPGSKPALARALHAAVVTLIRYAGPNMSPNNAASLFDPQDEAIRALLQGLEQRFLAAYPSNEHYDYERGLIRNELAAVVQQWLTWRQGLVYDNKDRGAKSLMKPFNNSQSNTEVGFKTMNSMRGVDVNVEVRL